MFFGGWVFLAEAAWIIYGNTFIYSQEIRDCTISSSSFIKINDEIDSLRITTLILIIYGYLLLLVILGLIIFYIGAYLGFKSRLAGDMENIASQEENSGGIKRSATQKMADSATANPTITMAFTRLLTRKGGQTNRYSS